MYFPATRHDALENVRRYTGGPVSRELVESALDFFIMLEPDEMGRGGTNHDRFKVEIDKANRILQTFGNTASTFEDLQELFYSFSTSSKYRYTATTISVVRAALNGAWDGIHGWRD